MKKGIQSSIVTGLLSATLICSGMIGVMNPIVSEAAPASVVGGAVADETSPRSLSIYKYAVKDASELGNPGTGEAVDGIDKTPLEGIKFKIQRVTAKEGGKPLEDPLTVKEGTDYTIDGSFEEKTITTGADGKATQALGTGISADGIYLVTELPDDRGVKPSVAKPADPFFVYIPQTKRDDTGKLIYDVVVQPKNILETLMNPVKTVNGGSGYSIKAGQEFTWEATATVPAGLYTVASQDMKITPIYDDKGEIIPDAEKEVKKGDEIYANYFHILDNIDKNLELLDVTTQVKKTGDAEWTDLTFNTDYEVKVNNEAKPTKPITDSTADVKPVDVSLTQAGMKKAQSYDQIRVVYKTKTGVDFNGTVENAFRIKFLTPGNKPVTPGNEDKPKYYTGGFDLTKKGESATGTENLAGAEFHIADTKADAEKNIFLGLDGKRYGKKDGDTLVGGTLAEAEAAAEAAGTSLMKSTSAADGKVTFNGLKLIWFNDANGNGQQDAGEADVATSDIKKSYWVVETKAPSGYELIKAPQEIVVTLDTASKSYVDIVNKKETKLPFTGGTGTTIIVVIAIGAIASGAVMLTMDKKRKHA
ncbi:hypothetical protein BW731_07465 [Vagococcus martis]|uniref:Gram-positive pilin subunit D1 N-terminal domain-containing protein n=1 Tax=Vagococcus martis TaxID=1768210 RepID=A0A1V4DII3_9ENTE|nr:SpaH/EbpB family LPXTG-anchored major pilin [Vagococcus martis]OPF88020.1 hypothetical protein BW731_07465 [Vagococcus martis]